MSLAAAKARLRHNVALTCLAYVLHDGWVGWRLRRGWHDTESGTASAGVPVAGAVGYLESVHRGYQAYAAPTVLSGVVAEIGPGDTHGGGLLFRADGARAYHGIDRYRPCRDAAHQTAVHQALADKLGRRDLLDANSETGIDGVYYHHGLAAEEFFRQSGLGFDAILSWAVLEHLYDPIGALDDMLAALHPGGVMVHVVDLRDHGLFAGRHPLTFLTIADWIYRRMARNSGRPNRVRHADYAAWLANSGAAGQVLVTALVANGDENQCSIPATPLHEAPSGPLAEAIGLVRSLPGRLASRFRALPEADLAVAGLVLVVRRPI